MPRLAPRRRALRLAALTLSILFATQGAAGQQPAGPPAAAAAADVRDSAREARLAWFRDAKYGLFIHWGLYAIPAGRWKGKPVPGLGEWIMNRARIPVAEYEGLAKRFDPVRFDADAWVRLARAAGMKYIVITAKHHDGFALFDSKVSRFDVVDATPFRRDVLAQLAAACARHGVRLGFYYSQAQDWHEPNGAGNTWDFGPDSLKDFDAYLRGKAEPQVRELLTRYGPVALIWFDTPRMMNGARARRFTDLVRSLQPNTLIDGRLGAAGDYVSTGDNVIPTDVRGGDAWEVPATLNHTWGYRSDDRDWKSPGDVIFKLVDITSKGGNYLLNVGPTAGGTIPAAAAEVLRTAGDWLRRNGEAVYGAKPTPFGEELGEPSARGTKDLRGNPLVFARDEYRVTAKPGKLYFTFFTEPRVPFTLPRMQNAVKRAYRLGDGAPIEVREANGERQLVLPRFPAERPGFLAIDDPMGTVVVVEIEGEVARPLPRRADAGPGLTGNWVVRQPMGDGTERRSYFDLREEGDRIGGTIRVTQFFYRIVESAGGRDTFTVVGSMRDGRSERRVTYAGKLVGDTLRLFTRRRPEDRPTELLATRAPAGEGAMPARIAPPPRRTVRDNGLARTPPMGWNSWNKFAGRVDDAAVRAMADAMATNGMRDAGYVYVNIDDTWEGGRDAAGNIVSNRKFPDMKALADYVHARGLKLGIYSSPGPNTCAGYEGSYGHEEQDARTFAAWGIDYIKYDWCGARNIYTDEEMPAVYQKMGEALRKTGRDIVYSICQYGRLDVWRWGADVGGNLWRTTGDIRDTWESMTRIGFSQDSLAPFARPGHWNDPDMLEIGNGGMSADEYRTHMSLWAVLAAPLLAGNDLRTMTPEIRDILLDRDVIAVNQDRAGRQGRRVWQLGEQEIWTRPLAGGDVAVALFNRGSAPAPMTARWSELGVGFAPRRVRDLWAHADVSSAGAEHAALVPAHGVVMLRLGR